MLSVRIAQVSWCQLSFGFGDFWPKSRSVVFGCILATKGGAGLTDRLACGFHGQQTVGKSFEIREKNFGKFALKQRPQGLQLG